MSGEACDLASRARGGANTSKRVQTTFASAWGGANLETLGDLLTKTITQVGAATSAANVYEKCE